MAIRIIFSLLIGCTISTISVADAFSVDPPFATQQGVVTQHHLALEQRTAAKGNFGVPSSRRNTNVRVFAFAKDALLSNSGSAASPQFVIREAQEQDLGAAANILADAFSTKLNFFAQRMERMNTYLGLKSRFETFRYAERSGALQCMLVATATTPAGDDEVVAFCEVDNRPPGGEINPAPRPYISNLAVRDDRRRIGMATALVGESEEIVRGGWGEPSLHLCVDNVNDAAKTMYQDKCGYTEILSRRRTTAKGETILLLGKTL